MSFGYAVTDERGDVLVDTVSPERRGALVNWLYVHGGVMVRDGVSEKVIERL